MTSEDLVPFVFTPHLHLEGNLKDAEITNRSLDIAEIICVSIKF